MYKSLSHSFYSATSQGLQCIHQRVYNVYIIGFAAYTSQDLLCINHRVCSVSGFTEYASQGLQCICHRVYSVHHRVYSVFFTGFTVWIIHFLWCCRLPVQPFSSKIMLLLVWRRAQPKVIEKIYSYLLLFRWGFLIKKHLKNVYVSKRDADPSHFIRIWIRFFLSAI